jgi:uncharacterized protein GlcG (DUF336 family)
MLDYRTLSLEEAQRGIEAVLKKAKEINHQGIAAVVVDKAGDVIAAARMDGKAGRFFKAAHRKAYTSAIFERDTAGVKKFWNQQGEQGHRGPADWNDTMLTTLPGGFCVLHGKHVVGGFGVAGGNLQFSDEAFAEVGVQGLGPEFRHRVDWD